MGNPITKELTYSDNIIGYKGKRFNVLEKLHKGGTFKVYDTSTGSTKILSRTKLIRDDNRKAANRFNWSERRLSGSYFKMLYRCEHPYSPDYKDYGAKGIRVEDDIRDRSLFQDFALSINGLWMPGSEIHRLNSKDNYSKHNCIFLKSYYHHKYSPPSILIHVYRNIDDYNIDEWYGTLKDWSLKMNLSGPYLSNAFGNDIESMNAYVMNVFKEFFPVEKGWKVDNKNPLDYRDSCVEINLGLHKNILDIAGIKAIPEIISDNSNIKRLKYVEGLPLSNQYKIRKTELWWSKYLGYSQYYIADKFKDICFGIERQIAVREFIISELIKKHPEMVDMSMIEDN